MPARLPRNVKALRGTLRGDRDASEPVPALGIPKPSRTLPPDVRREYDKITRRAARLRVLTLQDGLAIELGALAQAEVWRYEAVIRKLGSIYETKTPQGSVMIRPRPEVALLADAWRRAVTVLKEYGLTAVSRGRVEELPPAAAESKWAGLISNDPLERMLRRRQTSLADFQRQRPARPAPGGAQ
jgi:hypothetical protein